MNSSLRLLLEDFLGLMREEGELDVFLPTLMSAMGHQVVKRPQKGQREHGVDVISVGRDEDGKRKYFMWLIKCGDIGRAEWNSGQNSVRQSVEDVSDGFLPSHVSPEHRKLPKKLLIVTNGDFNGALVQTMAGYLMTRSRTHGVETQQVNGATLAEWTEQHLLDEYVLPGGARARLRRMLANVSEPELCVRVGRELIDEMLELALAPAKSSNAALKRLLTGLRGIRTALRVLTTWAMNEENLSAPYTLSEYAVLAVWAKFHSELLEPSKELEHEFAELQFMLADVARIYHSRLSDYYCVEDAFAIAFPDHLLVSRTVFEELGRLGKQGSYWASEAVVHGEAWMEAAARFYANWLGALLRSHTCTELPAFDHYSAHVHAALVLLTSVGEHEKAKDWVEKMCARFRYACVHRKFLPTSASFEDALDVRAGDAAAIAEFCNTSTLLPLLYIWAAALRADAAFTQLRTDVMTRLNGMTPNMWTPEANFDSVVANAGELQQHGIAEELAHVDEDPDGFLRSQMSPLPGAARLDDASWYRANATHVPLLAGVHWRLQIPREMMAKQAHALCRGLAAASTPAQP